MNLDVATLYSQCVFLVYAPYCDAFAWMFETFVIDVIVEQVLDYSSNFQPWKMSSTL